MIVVFVKEVSNFLNWNAHCFVDTCFCINYLLFIFKNSTITNQYKVCFSLVTDYKNTFYCTCT